MLARTLNAQISPDRLDEFIQVFNSLLGSIVRQQKGFNDGYLLFDRNTGKIVSISFWENEADFQAWEKSSDFARAFGPLKAFLTSAPTLDLMEVSGKN